MWCTLHILHQNTWKENLFLRQIVIHQESLHFIHGGRKIRTYDTANSLGMLDRNVFLINVIDLGHLVKPI